MAAVTTAHPVITVRLARADEGPALESLYLASGKPPLPFVSWQGDVSPFWLVAVDEDGVGLGCINVRISKPVATVESLCIPAHTRKRVKAQVMLQLVYEAMHVCQSYGVQAVEFSIDARMGDWQRIVTKRGAVFHKSHPTYMVKVSL